MNGQFTAIMVELHEANAAKDELREKLQKAEEELIELRTPSPFRVKGCTPEQREEQLLEELKLAKGELRFVKDELKVAKAKIVELEDERAEYMAQLNVVRTIVGVTVQES